MVSSGKFCVWFSMTVTGREISLIFILSLSLSKGKVTGKSWANKNLIWAEKLGPQAFVPASPTSAVCLTVHLIDPKGCLGLFCFNFSFDQGRLGVGK